jgi:hypothetical protein
MSFFPCYNRAQLPTNLVIFLAIDFILIYCNFSLYSFKKSTTVECDIDILTSHVKKNCFYFLFSRSIVVNFSLPTHSLSQFYIFTKFNNKIYYFVASGQVAEFFMISSHMGAI